MSPPRKSFAAYQAYSEENFTENQRKRQQRRTKAQSKDYINVESNERINDSANERVAASNYLKKVLN